jgi:5-formyltetrahydrofolate cyclo-ligase
MFSLYIKNMDNKIDLRIKAKRLRKTFDIATLSKNAVAKIRQISDYKSAKNVLIFYPMNYEINLLELLNEDKKFYLPKVCGNELLVCPYSKNLKKSSLNVCEPCTNPVSADVIDLAIVPALMVDSSGYRLGYGGGFYDRFLSANPHIKTVVPIAKELFATSIPHETFDVKIDIIVRL